MWNVYFMGGGGLEEGEVKSLLVILKFFGKLFGGRRGRVKMLKQ